MIVEVDESSWTDVKSGVPQGSVMGPLYLLFVNDLPDIVTSGIKIFADDTKIWGSVKTVEDEDPCRATSPDSVIGHRSDNYNTSWTSAKPGMFPTH